MGVRFTKEYVAEVFVTHDNVRLYHLISLVDDEPNLPEELWLFCRLYEWSFSDWQYYECLSEAKFQRITAGLDRFGLHDLRKRFREGKLVWDDPEIANAFADWLQEHAGEVRHAAFRLAELSKEYLDGPAGIQNG